jgi:hypothetical protein
MRGWRSTVAIRLDFTWWRDFAPAATDDLGLRSAGSPTSSAGLRRSLRCSRPAVSSISDADPACWSSKHVRGRLAAEREADTPTDEPLVFRQGANLHWRPDAVDCVAHLPVDPFAAANSRRADGDRARPRLCARASLVALAAVSHAAVEVELAETRPVARRGPHMARPDRRAGAVFRPSRSAPSARRRARQPSTHGGRC